jgi:hypothetical protein
VPLDDLAGLILKELTDNALDVSAEVEARQLPDGSGFFVDDQGGGIDGTPEQIAELFSIARPLISTKLLRLPSRGVLGNGLRVVASAVLVSGGHLTVITRGRKLQLRPERDGTTTVVSNKPADRPIGTRVEIGFGKALPCDGALPPAAIAIRFANRGTSYAGRSSPHWYDPATFAELLYAAGDCPVRDLVASKLDGCSGGKAGEIVAQAKLGRALCRDVSRKQAETLLRCARTAAKPVTPERLGGVGSDVLDAYAYTRASGVAEFGASAPKAVIPFVVEAWAKETTSKTMLEALVNRTPVNANIRAARDKREINAFGCGLHHTITEAPKDSQFSIGLNITTPYMPITSDGKAPNFQPFLAQIAEAVGKAVKKARRPNARGTSQKNVVLENLDAAIAEVSGDGEYRCTASGSCSTCCARP